MGADRRTPGAHAPDEKDWFYDRAGLAARLGETGSLSTSAPSDCTFGPRCTPSRAALCNRTARLAKKRNVTSVPPAVVEAQCR